MRLLNHMQAQLKAAMVPTVKARPLPGVICIAPHQDLVIPLLSISAAPAFLALAMSVFFLDKIIIKLNVIINSLRSLNRTILFVHPQVLLEIAMALSAPVTPSICSRCIIKDGFFNNAIHFCVKTSPDNIC